MTELLLRVEPLSESNAPDLDEEISAAIRSQLNLRVPVEIVPTESLPRFELKAQRWIRE